MHIFEPSVADDGKVQLIRPKTEMSLGFTIGDVTEIEFPEGRIPPARHPGAIEEGRKRATVDAVGRCNAEPFAKCGKDVGGTGETVHDGSTQSGTRIADDKRDVVAAVKVTALAERPVITRHFGM